MTKPRILILENSVAVTGALLSIVRSSQYLSDRFEFVFLLPSGSSAFSYLKNRGFDCYELNMREIRKNVLALLIYFPFLLINVFKFARLVHRLKIDLVTVNDFYNLVPAVYKIFGGKIKYICYVRFRPSRFIAPLVQIWSTLNYRHAESVVAVSEVVKREMEEHEKCVIVPNELPGEEIPLIKGTSLVVLYVGNYIPGKGQQYAIESFGRIYRDHPDWRLRFIGGDMGLEKNKKYKASLKKKAEELGITDHIQWYDFKDNILDEYLKASIVLNFSESESFSLTCLEAMYCGRPVIATRSGGPEEMVEHKVNGLLLPTGDIDAMVEAMKLLMSHSDLRDQMGRAAYSFVRSKYSYENTILRLKQVYLEALKMNIV